MGSYKAARIKTWLALLLVPTTTAVNAHGARNALTLQPTMTSHSPWNVDSMRAG